MEAENTGQTRLGILATSLIFWVAEPQHGQSISALLSGGQNTKRCWHAKPLAASWADPEEQYSVINSSDCTGLGFYVVGVTRGETEACRVLNACRMLLCAKRGVWRSGRQCVHEEQLYVICLRS